MSETENPYKSPTFESGSTVPTEPSRQTIWNSIFSFKGRNCRSKFISSWLLLIFGLSVVCFPITLSVVYLDNDYVKSICFGCFGIVLIWGCSALLTKRLHDINHRGIMCLWVLVPLFVAVALRLEGPYIDRLLAWYMFLCWLYLACKTGTRGANRFGEDPVLRLVSAGSATVDENQDEIIYRQDLIGCQECSWMGTWAEAMASSPRDGFICPNCYADDPRRIPLSEALQSQE